MSDYISKWHKELGIFSKIKPLIILEGNVLDSYQYPEEGSTPKGSILRLPEYLHFYFKDMGYQNIVFYDSLRGFYNTCEEGYLENFAKLAEASASHGYIKADFKGGNKNEAASNIVRKTLAQNKEAKELECEIAKEETAKPVITKEHIMCWFENLKKYNIKNATHRRRLVDVFINAIYLFDDKIVLVFNFKDNTKRTKKEEIQKSPSSSALNNCCAPKKK